MGELFAELDDVVAFGFQQLEQRAQMRSGKRRGAAVQRSAAVHELMHAAAKVVGMSVA
jgi:hypothetical protein